MGSFQEASPRGFPVSRYLSDDEIASLCERDVQDLKDTFDRSKVAQDEAHLAVIPNHTMISYMFQWGDVGTVKTIGRTSPNHGAICESADTWLYWHHRMDKLVITRVRTRPGDKQGAAEALASLLLLAVEEARKMNFPTIAVWEPSEEFLQALELVKKDSTIASDTGPRANSITSVRWKGASKAKKTIFHLNENYAAS
jgi:hypothetical protein